MRTTSKSTTGFAKRPLDIWKVSGRSVTLDEFIQEGSNRLDAIGLRDSLRSLNGRLWEKLESINAEENPELREAVQLTIQVLRSPEAWQAEDPLPRWLAEAAFGARYFLKRFDLIEDHLPQIGLADDTQLLARILERNRLELSRYRHY
jgi:uncharacterized membrane protein YkvA (DUF1232 family)